MHLLHLFQRKNIRQKRLYPIHHKKIPWQQGTATYEKRGVAAFVPEWNSENCIQCNKCAYVCPHASIRPFVLDEAEQAAAPFTDMLKATGKVFDGMKFRIQVDVLDCLGCGNCADVCPGNKQGKALKMQPLEGQLPQAPNWEYVATKVKSKQHLVNVNANVKNSQFATPLFEFSGACNQFANQAAGTDEEIHEFCTLNYDVQFPQFKKLEVNGDNASDLFKFLKSEKSFAGFDMNHPIAKILDDMLSKENPNYKENAEIKWNFTKFLINRNGEVVKRFEPTEDLTKVEAEIKNLL